MSLFALYELVIVPYVRAFVGTRLGIRDDRGASLVEYALLVALIAVVCILAITFLGRNASDKLSNVSSSIGG